MIADDQGNRATRCKPLNNELGKTVNGKVDNVRGEMRVSESTRERALRLTSQEKSFPDDMWPRRRATVMGMLGAAASPMGGVGSAQAGIAGTYPAFCGRGIS